MATTEADDLDHSPMKRGKYGPDKGNPRDANWVAENDPGYLVWAYEAWTDKPCSALLYSECRKDVDEANRQRRVSNDQRSTD